MMTPDGYQATSWEKGYGDYVMKPIIETLRLMPWLEGTAIILCDVLDHHTHVPVSHSPRTVLQKQVARLRDIGFEAMTATELEFFLFKKAMMKFEPMDIETLNRFLVTMRIITFFKQLKKNM